VLGVALLVFLGLGAALCPPGDFPAGAIFSAPPAPCPRPDPSARRSTHRFCPVGAFALRYTSLLRFFLFFFCFGLLFFLSINKPFLHLKFKLNTWFFFFIITLLP
jgi:hypothetical protein